MQRGRGIDVFAVVLVAVLAVEAVGVFLAQQSVWPGNRWIAVRLDHFEPWMPATLAAAGALLVLEAIVRRRSEEAVFTRVVVGLVIAGGLAVATAVGLFTGVAHVTRPVG
jgi:hypothetical protein